MMTILCFAWGLLSFLVGALANVMFLACTYHSKIKHQIFLVLTVTILTFHGITSVMPIDIDKTPVDYMVETIERGNNSVKIKVSKDGFDTVEMLTMCRPKVVEGQALRDIASRTIIYRDGTKIYKPFESELSFSVCE